MLQRVVSIFLTLWIFLAGGNFVAASNEKSSAPLGDLWASAVHQEFLTTMGAQWTWANCIYLNPSSNDTEHTDDSESNRQEAKNSEVLKTHRKASFQSCLDSYLRPSVFICGSVEYFSATHHHQSSSPSSDLYALAVNSSSLRRTTADGKTIDLTYNPDGHRLSKFITQNGLTQRLVHYLTNANNSTGYAQVIEEKDSLDTSNPLRKVNLYGHDLISSLITDHSALITQSEYLFTGEQYDSDLGMYFLRARYLNTNTGRFHTQDTYKGRNGEPLTLHKYLYAGANPVMDLDPTGLYSQGEGYKVERLVRDDYKSDFGYGDEIPIGAGQKWVLN